VGIKVDILVPTPIVQVLTLLILNRSSIVVGFYFKITKEL